MSISVLDRVRQALRVRYRAAAFRRAVKIELDVPVETIGDPSYGGYSIPGDCWVADSLVVSVGAGTDVRSSWSWFRGRLPDVRLRPRAGRRRVYEPRGGVRARISFERLAIWNEDTELSSMRPARRIRVTLCRRPARYAGVFTAPARTLSTLAEANGWRPRSTSSRSRPKGPSS